MRSFASQHCGFAFLSAAAFGLAASAHPAQAALTTYSATDKLVVPGGASPNSDAAAASFDSAASLIGPETLVNFEAAPVGSFSSLTLAPGVTLTGVDYRGNPLQILNSPSNPAGPQGAGFNTTPGGSNYLLMQGGIANFTFASPVQSFGAYFTGIQPQYYQDTITFNDGENETINVPAADPYDGGVSFAGFTDPGAAITQVTITAQGNSGEDFIGVDDVRFSSAVAAVPEPAPLALLGLGLLPLGIWARRVRQQG